MDRLEKRLSRLLPRRWRRRTDVPAAENVAVDQLRKMIIVKNIQSMASQESLVCPPTPELVSSPELLRENRSAFLNLQTNLLKLQLPIVHLVFPRITRGHYSAQSKFDNDGGFVGILCVERERRLGTDHLQKNCLLLTAMWQMRWLSLPL